MPSDLATPVETVRIDPMALIKLAVEKGMSRDDLQTLFALHRQVTADAAAEKFAAALAKFQAECPVITKTRQVFNRAKEGQAPQLRYVYENFDDLMDTVGPVLTRCG